MQILTGIVSDWPETPTWEQGFSDEGSKMQRNSTHFLICSLEKQAEWAIHSPVVAGNGQLGPSGVPQSRMRCRDPQDLGAASLFHSQDG